MKKVLLLFLAVGFVASLTADVYQDQAQHFFNRGHGLSQENRFAESAKFFLKAARMEKRSKSPRYQWLCAAWTWVGFMNHKMGRNKAAISHFKKALILARKLGDKRLISSNLANIGTVYQTWGRYRDTIQYYKKSLTITRELRNGPWIAAGLNNIGTVYLEWGSYKDASRYFKQALAMNKKLNRTDQIAVNLNNIGRVYQEWNRDKKALEYYKQALFLNRKINKMEQVAVNIASIGNIYYRIGDYNKALKFFKNALAINKKLKSSIGITGSLNSIGLVYADKKSYKKAIRFYRRALRLDRRIGNKSGMAVRYNNMGALYWSMKNYHQAAKYFRKSIAIIEELRLTADGKIKRDYLASQIGIYHWLVSTYIRERKIKKALNAIELSRAKYLGDQLMAKMRERSSVPFGIERFQKKLKSDTAVIAFSNIDTHMGLAAIVATRRSVSGIEVDDSRLLEKLGRSYRENIARTYNGLRGIMIKAKKRERKIIVRMKQESTLNLEKIINYYRVLLIRPDVNEEERRVMRDVSRELYLFLIKPIEKRIKRKKRLVIMPDGILNFLPFETLIMPDGRYLVEKYHIVYLQSLRISGLIAKRKYRKERKRILLSGAPVYRENRGKRAGRGSIAITSGQELDFLIKKATLALKQGSHLGKIYRALGYGNWGNLPGTLIEINEIKRIIPEAHILSGKDLTETTLKRMSISGELSRYKTLHFAVHGLTVPDIPELSALVLSQNEKPDQKEDGYLTLSEIAALDLKADFVNLSACDTGLGKIYGGEGVVGLTQAFLLAGANGLSVSLWQVADRSTMEFMTNLYRLVKKRGLSHARAITAVKRNFIQGKSGKKYTHPFFWTPFVYYGGLK